MLKSFYKSSEWAEWAYGGGVALILSLWLQVQMSVAINTWYKGFFMTYSRTLQNMKKSLKKTFLHHMKNLFNCNIY